MQIFKIRKSVSLPAFLSQFVNYPLYGRPSLSRVVGDGVDDDVLHVAGERHPLHGDQGLLLQQRLALRGADKDAPGAESKVFGRRLDTRGHRVVALREHELDGCTSRAWRTIA